MEHPSVTLLRQYLRIKSAEHPNAVYDESVSFIRDQATKMSLPCHVVEPKKGKPTVVLEWRGLDPDLPSIMVNSHMDVVPVVADKWKHHPFDAYKDEEGNIFARGAQDMKSIGICHLEAVRRLQEEGFQPKRTFFITFVPDEEIGGHDGMGLFTASDFFKKMNVGFELDEGICSPTEEFFVYYSERVQSWVDITCEGNPGHGCLFIEDTAAEKAQFIINRMLEFRESQKLLLTEDIQLGDVTTVNLTTLKGGIQRNVVPTSIQVGFDCRVTPKTSLQGFRDMVQGWVDQVGAKAVFADFEAVPGTPKDEEFPWSKAIRSVGEKHGIKTEFIICPGRTDAAYLRKQGIPAFGFSPINKTPVLLHDHNEFINEKIFLRGIDIMCDTIKQLASV